MSNQLKLNSLRIIENHDGSVMHALKSSEIKNFNFGEAYFSTVNFLKVKGWKKHLKMTMNIIVPCGAIKFVIFDNQNEGDLFKEFILSKKNYKRLTVPPNFWFGFQGLSRGENILLNLSNIEHDPNETENIDLDDLKYDWGLKN